MRRARFDFDAKKSIPQRTKSFAEAALKEVKKSAWRFLRQLRARNQSHPASVERETGIFAMLTMKIIYLIKL
jgi:hypothetical protein